MPLIKWNFIKITGHSNLVLQDVEGRATEISIAEFIKQFTLEKEKRINELEELLADKRQIQQFTQERLDQWLSYTRQSFSFLYGSPWIN